MNSRTQEILLGSTGAVAPIHRAETTKNTTAVFAIPVEQIDPDPDNARKHFDADSLEALAEDIKRHGQIQNAVVVEDRSSSRYTLVAGERRWRACKLAGVPTLLCSVLPRRIADEVKAEIAFAENMSRSDLRPVEVARHWQALMERWNCTGRELAARVGVAQSTVSKRLALLKLDAGTQQAVDAGRIKRSHVVEGNRTRRRATPGRRPARGVLELAAGTVRLKRGHTLEALAVELAEHLAKRQRPAA